MIKKNLLIFGIILLGSMFLMTSYTPPSNQQINMTSFCTGYTAPSNQQINITFVDNDDCAAAHCWGYDTTNRLLYVPAGCEYYVPAGTEGYI
jgi:hypothetical protein